jgi:hypothetical protein
MSPYIFINRYLYVLCNLYHIQVSIFYETGKSVLLHKKRSAKDIKYAKSLLAKNFIKVLYKVYKEGKLLVIAYSIN